MNPKVHVETIIKSPLLQLWPIVRDFNSLPSWHPAVIESVLENKVQRVGCIRRYKRKDGLTLRERLVALDDAKHSLSYTLLDAPIPVSDYLATLRLSAIRHMNATHVEWLAWFNCAPDVEAALHESITGVFRAGLDCLSRKEKP